MAGPAYHGWTHRPKALGGTDPIEFPVGLAPVAYCDGDGFTAEDGAFYGLGILSGFDPDEFGVADNITVANVVSDGSLGAASSIVLYQDAGDAALQIYGEQMIALHAGALLADPLGAGVTLTMFLSNMYGDQWNEAMTAGFAQPNISFNCLLPYHGALWDEFTTAIWPSNKFDVKLTVSGGDVDVIQTVINVCLVTAIGEVVNTAT